MSHRARMTVWLVAALAGFVLVTLTGHWFEPSPDGRHFWACAWTVASVFGLVVEAERRP